MEQKFREVQEMLVTKMRETNMSRDAHIPIKAEIDALKVLLEDEEKRCKSFYSDGHVVKSSSVSVPLVTHTTTKHVTTTGGSVGTGKGGYSHGVYRARSVEDLAKKSDSYGLQRSRTLHYTTQSVPTVSQSVHGLLGGKTGKTSYQYQYGSYGSGEPRRYGNVYYTYRKPGTTYMSSYGHNTLPYVGYGRYAPGYCKAPWDK